MVAEHGMRAHDAEVVIAAGCLFHDTGMSIHRTDHESFSLFLAADRLPLLLEDVYDGARAHGGHGGGAARRDRPPPPRRAVHDGGRRRCGWPTRWTWPRGRSRVPFETRRPNIHSLSAAAIDAVTIEPGAKGACASRSP